MGRRRKYSPRTFEKACEAYFRRRAYEVPVQRLVPNGRTNAKGLPAMVYENVIYDLNMFIVNVRTAESMKTLILKENEDKKIEVVASLRLI